MQIKKYRRAVSLPGDREEDRERERSIGDQLNNIISHIEVKHIVNTLHKILRWIQISTMTQKCKHTIA